MVVGAKVCELTDGFLGFVCGNFDVFPKSSRGKMKGTVHFYIST